MAFILFSASSNNGGSLQAKVVNMQSSLDELSSSCPSRAFQIAINTEVTLFRSSEFVSVSAIEVAH
uniref:Uncharacterized protein n=1 Tax=Arundo donax TaxID=35708 RepID=A0A0A9ETZ7_ARUDO